MTRSHAPQSRLDRLQEHLRNENTDLVNAVDSYRDLDSIAHRIGLMPKGESYANNISWWPLVAILGTFSAGKSSFINSYLGLPIQETGNQAVDDHFTIIAYGHEKKIKTLPGQALDGDPRFPFYRISKDIESVAPGEGTRIDKYLQMKVAPSSLLKGRLLIDSPGFDADEQRSSTLRITNHIIRLSDLVLIFFDARHPETGAMQDTLEHLVRDPIGTSDSEKFIYVLNLIDTSANENNLEDIVASWRSSLVQYGLNAGKFYISYNKDIAIPIEDKDVWSSYEKKRDQDYAQIMDHLDSLNMLRSYRIVGGIKLLANDIEQKAMPRLSNAYRKWRNRVLLVDAVLLALLAVAAFTIWYRNGGQLSLWMLISSAALAVIAALGLHFLARRMFASRIARTLREHDFGDLRAAFAKSTSHWRSLLFSNPAGCSRRAKRKLDDIRNTSEVLIENLNTNNIDPSGRSVEKPTEEPVTPPIARIVETSHRR